MARCSNNLTLLDDMPDLDAPEWHDDFMMALESIDAKELDALSSLDELLDSILHFMDSLEKKSSQR